VSLHSGKLAVHRFSTSRIAKALRFHRDKDSRYILRSDRRGTLEAGAAGATLSAERAMMTIFEIRTAYHNSLANMRNWFGDEGVSGRLTVLDRLSILDAWQQEMVEFFERHGFCFACNRRLDRCRCRREVE